MTFLKKQSTAIIITVIVAVLFSFIGCSRSLSKQADKVEEMFTVGVYRDMESYVQPSIQSQLDKRIDASLGLLTVANHYPELSDAAGYFRDARGALIKADTLPRKYLKNEELSRTGSELISALSSATLSKDDAEAVKAYISTFNGAQGVIEKSDYNSKVTEYVRIAKTFPANIFGIFADSPDYFQVEG